MATKKEQEEIAKFCEEVPILESPEDMSKHLDDLNDKLYAKMDGMKATSKLKKKKKSNIPGFGYYFKQK